VDDLLNISRIEAGKLAFQFKKGDIDRVIKEVVSSLILTAKGKKIKLEYISPAVKPPPFYFDESKMIEVISNLVDNAIKYTQGGWIKVILKNGRKKVRIIVADSGIGISKGELRYIFEKFQRGREINNIHTEGTGLGLFVCQKIVEAHNGRVWAESAGRGKGSRFIVELEKNFQPPQRPA
jgi:signal transduction histidine kinase